MHKSAKRLIPVNLSTLNYGILVGWPSPVQPLLQNKTHPAIGDIPFTDDMIALAGSTVYIGATLGSCFWALVANMLGRKKTSVLIVLPYVISWALVCFRNDRNSLYLARMIGGLGNAGSVINSPMYVAEICTPRLRDRLGPFLMLSSCLGTTYAYLCGWLLPFHCFNAVNLVLATISLAATCYLPESPVFYLKCNQTSKARRSLAWLRRYDACNPHHQTALANDLQVLEESFLNRGSLTPWRDVLTIPSTRNAVLLGLGLISCIQLCGVAVVIVNVVSLFQSTWVQGHSSTLLTPHFCSVIVGVIQVISAIASVHVVGAFNRKPLLVSTYAIIALSTGFLGLFYFLKSIDYPYLSLRSPVPLISLCLFTAAYYTAAGPVVFVLLSEIFPAETRNICMGIVMVYQHALMFAVVRSFPALTSRLGLHGCMWMYSVATLVGVVMIYKCVPETRHKSFKTIVRKLSGHKLTAINNKQHVSLVDQT